MANIVLTLNDKPLVSEGLHIFQFTAPSNGMFNVHFECTLPIGSSFVLSEKLNAGSYSQISPSIAGNQYGFKLDLNKHFATSDVYLLKMTDASGLCDVHNAAKAIVAISNGI